MSSLALFFARRVSDRKTNFATVPKPLQPECAEHLIKEGRSEFVPVEFGGTLGEASE